MANIGPIKVQLDMVMINAMLERIAEAVDEMAISYHPPCDEEDLHKRDAIALVAKYIRSLKV